MNNEYAFYAKVNINNNIGWLCIDKLSGYYISQNESERILMTDYQLKHFDVVEKVPILYIGKKYKLKTYDNKWFKGYKIHKLYESINDGQIYKTNFRTIGLCNYYNLIPIEINE